MSKKRSRVIGMGKDIFKEDEFEQDSSLENFIADKSAIINLQLEQIFPNPDQPRKFFGEEGIKELSESIKTHGILQPIIVKKEEDYFILVAGERRYRASKLAGLKKIPALIRSDNPLEISIIENIQRENLKPLEEAEGLQTLIDRFGYTHEDLAKVIGKSRSSITETLSLNKLPEKIKIECRTTDNHSKSHFLEVVRQKTESKMLEFWEQIKKGNFSVKQARRSTQKKERPKPFKYKFVSPAKDFSLVINFKKSEVGLSDIKTALEKALNDLLLK